MRLRRLVLIALVLASCKKKSAHQDADYEVARTIGNDVLGKASAALAAAKANTPRSPELGLESCNAAVAVIPQLRLGPDVLLATELDALCGHDLPLAELGVAVTAVEADPAACATTMYAATAIALLRDPSNELAKRYRARCPT
ncbi:MAG: hypothetical protein ABI867_32860 [Kofleriaceae bacterium]